MLYIGSYENIMVVEGRVADCDSEFIVLRKEDRTLCLYRLSDVRHFEIFPERENDYFKKEAAEEYENPVSVDTSANDLQNEIVANEEFIADSGLFRTDAEKDAAKGPKVLGKIDLARIPDRKRRRIYDTQSKPVADDGTGMMRPTGYVNRIGMKFGWITPYDNPESSVYMSLNEIICCDGIVGIPQRGDDVIYTPGRNNVGPTAQCVHKVCTFGQQEELIERLSGYDNRNARLLREQIEAQMTEPDARIEESITEEKNENNEKPRPQVKVHILPSSPVVPEVAEETSETLLPGRELPYDEFIDRIYSLLDEIANDPDRASMSHQVLSRGISRARAEGDTAGALVLCDKALNYFEPDSGSHRYFSSIRENISLFNTQEGLSTEGTPDNENYSETSAE